MMQNFLSNITQSHPLCHDSFQQILPQWRKSINWVTEVGRNGFNLRRLMRMYHKLYHLEKVISLWIHHDSPKLWCCLTLVWIVLFCCWEKRSGLDQERLVFGTKPHHNSVIFNVRRRPSLRAKPRWREGVKLWFSWGLYPLNTHYIGFR